MSAEPPPAPPPRNPGPSWGYRFLRGCDRVLPEPVFRPLRALGTAVALAFMPRQRRHSRDYLRVVLGREPRWRDVFRHFLTFEEFLMLKLRVINGRPHRGVLAPGADSFRDSRITHGPALLGTFHLGHSDLIGFLFGAVLDRPVHMVRLRVGNAHDTEMLGEKFGRWVTFIWINAGDNPLIALKEAITAGGSVALKCDRLEFSARAEPFRFLGARRSFPFTIYHLAMIFQRPVVLSFGLPGGPGVSVVHGTPVWEPDPARSRAENLAAARAHFQAFLDLVERHLREDPWQWFNFLPLNPEVEEPA